MKIEDTALRGVKLITPRRFGDPREEFFAETWNAKVFAEAGIALEFVQDNHSISETTRHGAGPAFPSTTAWPGQTGALWQRAPF